MRREDQALREAVWAELQKAVPSMVRKHQEEAAKRAAIQSRARGFQTVVEECRQAYEARMKEKAAASRALQQKRWAALQAALASGDTEAFTAALAAMAHGISK